MTYAEYRKLARTLRERQKHFFRHKDNIEECRALEVAFDRATDEEGRRGREGPGLFGAPEGESCT